CGGYFRFFRDVCLLPFPFAFFLLPLAFCLLAFPARPAFVQADLRAVPRSASHSSGFFSRSAWLIRCATAAARWPTAASSGGLVRARTASKKRARWTVVASCPRSFHTSRLSFISGFHVAGVSRACTFGSA